MRNDQTLWSYFRTLKKYRLVGHNTLSTKRGRGNSDYVVAMAPVSGRVEAMIDPVMQEIGPRVPDTFVKSNSSTFQPLPRSTFLYLKRVYLLDCLRLSKIIS